MSDFAKTTALFRSIIKQYEHFCIQSVEIENEIITVTIDLDTTSAEPHRINLMVMLNTQTEILTMYARVVFELESTQVSSILSIVNGVQFSVFQEDYVCSPVYIGPAPDGKSHNFYVTANQIFIGKFINNRPDTDTVRSCEALIKKFVSGYGVIFNTLYREFHGKETVSKRRRMN